jgi:hypothetical protein
MIFLLIGCAMIVFPDKSCAIGATTRGCLFKLG